MKYIFLGSFSMGGTGYTTILRNIAVDLCNRGHEVMILGINYEKSEHNFPFKLVPLERSWSWDALRKLPDWWKADRVIIALDVPDLHQLAGKFVDEDEKDYLWQFEAIFPIESHPLVDIWANALGMFKYRYVISEYGTRVCIDNGLTRTVHLPMGCLVGKRPASKQSPREMLEWDQEKTIFLSIGANHERKNYPQAMKAFARLPEDTHYYIVTDPDSKLGWKLGKLADEYGIQDRFNVIRAGLREGLLTTMRLAADALVVPSQAEGACLPIYEAAQDGLPVICGSWTAMEDVMEEPWVLPVDSEYDYRYPWGNVQRWFASVNSLHVQMLKIHMGLVDVAGMSQAALEYAENRPWSLATDIIEQGPDEEPDDEEVPEDEPEEVQG